MPGALFALGDGHARQGEGEVCGVAVETAMDTVLVVDLIKGVATPWPRIESDTHLMSIGCARPLEDAYRISQHDLVTWTAGLTGLDTLDAYQLISPGRAGPGRQRLRPELHHGRQGRPSAGCRSFAPTTVSTSDYA